MISEEVKPKLDEFLRRYDVSYTLPGRNNQIYTGKMYGKSTFAPKKYMLWTYKELAEIVLCKNDKLLWNENPCDEQLRSTCWYSSISNFLQSLPPKWQWLSLLLQ